jgi:hypothetical protein
MSQGSTHARQFEFERGTDNYVVYKTKLDGNRIGILYLPKELLSFPYATAFQAYVGSKKLPDDELRELRAENILLHERLKEIDRIINRS